MLGVSRSRISQIGNGKIEAMELETLRVYAIALGGHLDVTVSVGPPLSEGGLKVGRVVHNDVGSASGIGPGRWSRRLTAT